MRAASVAIALAAVVATGCSDSGSPPQPPSTPPVSEPSSTPSAYTSPPATLPATPVTLSTQAPPWLPPAAIDNGKNSAAFIDAAGLPHSEEMLEVHYHAHLDIKIDGKPVTVPLGIGYVIENGKATLAPLHTHDQSGIVHIENSVPATFVLGQFFIEWGVKFTPRCLGPFCTGHGKELAVFVNGKRYGADPTRLVLAQHQEIAVEYGDQGSLPTPPSSYTFPSGL